MVIPPVSETGFGKHPLNASVRIRKEANNPNARLNIRFLKSKALSRLANTAPIQLRGLVVYTIRRTFWKDSLNEAYDWCVKYLI